MSRPKQARALELEPLNLTPLLDILFNLIFFFVLATTLKEEIPAKDVDMPESATNDTMPIDKNDWILTFGVDGALFLNEDEITSAELQTRIDALKPNPEGPQRVRVRGDKAATIQQLFDVLDILEESEHVKPFIEVDRRRKAP